MSLFRASRRSKPRPNVLTSAHLATTTTTASEKKKPQLNSKQQFAGVVARLPALALPRRGRPSLVVRAAIEAPRPSSPQPPSPQKRNSSNGVAAAAASEVSNASTTAAVEEAGISPLPSSSEGEEKKRESVLCTRLAGAHSKAVTALLVLNDRGENEERERESGEKRNGGRRRDAAATFACSFLTFRFSRCCRFSFSSTPTSPSSFFSYPLI